MSPLELESPDRENSNRRSRTASRAALASISQITYQLPASSDTSGMSRAPSEGTPVPLCQEGLEYTLRWSPAAARDQINAVIEISGSQAVGCSR